jgi:hypothetical protein
MRHPSDEQLQDLAEGILEPGKEDELRGHLVSCTTCRQYVDALAELRRAAAGLAFDVAPPGGEWHRIEVRLREPRGSAIALAGSEAHPDVSPARPARTMSLVRAAGWVVAIGIGVGGLATGLRDGTDESPRDLSNAPTAALPSEVVSDAYAASIYELQLMLAEGAGRLEPETLQVIEENLQIIETALERAHAEIAGDPGSTMLTRSLNSLYDAKVRLLSAAVALSDPP